MDGRGRWQDNIIIKRFECSLKYECVYLYAFKDGFEAHKIIVSWVNFYNSERLYSSLSGITPVMKYKQKVKKAS